MKEWSLEKPPDNWRVKLYFDTNILMFIADNTFAGLNHAIAYLKSKDAFVDLISSEYALFEFLDNRKKKHYKAHLHKNKLYDSNWFIDRLDFLSNLIGYRLVKAGSKFKWKNYYSYNIAGFSYMGVYQDVLTKVEAEITSLRNTLDYEDNVFNSELFGPTKQLCLTSRISRHDCMITTSASFPNNGLKLKDIVIWTGDEDYFKAFNECTELSNIFVDNKPHIEWISDLKYTERGRTKSINLENNPSSGNVISFAKNKIIQYIREQNRSLYLGVTDRATKLKDIVYIKYENKVDYPKDGIYLMVVGKDLDFIISSKVIKSFWLEGSELTEATFNSVPINSVISIKWSLPDSHQQWSGEIISALKENGHHVFLTQEV